MKKLLVIGFVLALAVFLAVPALAASGYRYYVRIDIHNTGEATVTDRVQITMPADTLVDDSYIQADAEDVALTAAGVAQDITAKDLGSDSAVWLLDYVTLGAGYQVSRHIWMGDPSAARDQVWIGIEDDAVTVADAASLDITTGLEIDADIYLDDLPSGERNILSKQGNYALTVDSSDFNLYAFTGEATETLYPNADGASHTCYVNSNPGTANNYQEVDETPASDADYVNTPDSGIPNTGEDIYNLDNSGLGDTDYIYSVTVHYRSMTIGYDGTATPEVYLGSTSYYGDASNLTGSFVSYSYTWFTNPATGKRWDDDDLDSLQAGISLYCHKEFSTDVTYCSQLYVTVDYSSAAQYVVSSISASTGSWVAIEATYNGTALAITDGSSSDSNPLVGALNTSTDDLLLFDLTAKLDSVIIKSAGTAVLNFEFEPDEISADTITDLSASSNDATYSLQSMNGDLDVTVNKMSPYLVASYTGAISYEEPLGLSIALPDEPENFTNDDGTYDGFPGSLWINAVLDDLNVPRGAFWLTLFFTVMLMVGFVTFDKARGDIIALIVVIVAIGIIQTVWGMGLGYIDLLMLMVPMIAMYIRREKRTNAL